MTKTSGRPIKPTFYRRPVKWGGRSLSQCGLCAFRVARFLGWICNLVLKFRSDKGRKGEYSKVTLEEPHSAQGAQGISTAAYAAVMCDGSERFTDGRVCWS
ncbi:hypothetical protein BV898_09209 [Hypsibius exemplaris]|uniref:Uncharacterized protein n=1 Tax=Hypsibius exemplaris TaxID=2072580 RepID=A0A1W0WNB8_HYPEX|nr:hypothetical protein BV898_09209 [Hypsibius exemplaris]